MKEGRWREWLIAPFHQPRQLSTCNITCCSCGPSGFSWCCSSCCANCILQLLCHSFLFALSPVHWIAVHAGVDRVCALYHTCSRARMREPKSRHLDVGNWISPNDESSSSPETTNLTPDSSNGRVSPHRGGEEGEQEQDGDMPADQLLRPDQGEVYELRQGVRRKRSGRLNLEGAYYYDDDDDGHRDNDDGEDDEDVAYTPEEERAVVRKFDRRLVLFVALLYLLSFLDRSSLSHVFLARLSRPLRFPLIFSMNPTCVRADWSHPICLSCGLCRASGWTWRLKLFLLS